MLQIGRAEGARCRAHCAPGLAQPAVPGAEVEPLLHRVVHHAGQRLGQAQLAGVVAQYRPGPAPGVVARPGADDRHVAEHRAGRDAAEDPVRQPELVLGDEMGQIMGYDPILVVPRELDGEPVLPPDHDDVRAAVMVAAVKLNPHADSLR